MNKLQEHQYQMMVKFDEICKKNNIKYSLAGGTLLGAVRHKGFIPWDDDLDIMMSRKDYNKFLEIAQSELGKKYFVQTLNTEKHYGLPFAKIRENNTLFLENMSKDVDINNGVFIDIFPYDNITDNIFLQKYYTKKYIFLRMILLLKEKYVLETDSIIKKIIVSFLKIIKIFLSKKHILKAFKKIENKYSNMNTNYVAIYGDASLDKIVLEKKIFNELIDLDFEKSKFKCIKNWDKYLAYIYGDYMQLPPVEERGNRHGAIEIKL